MLRRRHLQDRSCWRHTRDAADLARTMLVAMPFALAAGRALTLS
jgi:hypothetical protein